MKYVKVKSMKRFYRVEWWLQREGEKKAKAFSNREVAERLFDELSNSLGRGCWVSVDEFMEEDEEQGFSDMYNMLHYIEIE